MSDTRTREATAFPVTEPGRQYTEWLVAGSRYDTEAEARAALAEFKKLGWHDVHIRSRVVTIGPWEQARSRG